MLATLRDTDPALLQAFAREIIEREVSVALYDQDGRLARNFARSGFFDAIKGATPDQAIAQAMTIIQLGRSWNMQPSDAMQHLYFVKGRPAIQNEYMAAKMRDAGLDWEIEWTKTDGGEVIGCTLWPSRLGADGKWAPIMERANGVKVPASVSFTKADADRVKVKEDGAWVKLSEKSTYQAWMADMLFWRCIARLRRRYCTNILSGIMTRDEAEELPDTEIQKALPAPKMVVEQAEEPKPAREAKKVRGAKDIVPAETAPAVADVVVPAPVATTPIEAAPVVIIEQAVPVVESTGVVIDREAILVRLRGLRDEADNKGEGLFAAHLKDANPEMQTPTQLRELNDADLQQHLVWLEMRAKQTWRKNKDNVWVKGLF